MARRGKPRIQLVWRHKDLALLTQGTSTYEWVEPADYRVSEVRLLHDVETIGENPDSNLLIQGDALHALTALIKTPEYATSYVGKVKLCYIDPPFNTGQAFTHYDDGVEHSVWLTMLRDRLDQIQKLLCDDGSVWLHLDDVEGHRARVVMDEVFGAENFIATIVWEKASGAKGDTDISVSHDYIHVYAKDASRWKAVRNLLPRSDQQLTRYSNPDGDPRGPWRQGADGTAKSGNETLRFPITTPSGRVVTPPKGNYWRFKKETFDEAVAEGRVWFGKDGNSLPVIKTYLSEIKAGVVPTTWWSGAEAGSNQEAKRDHLRKMFPDIEPFATPKPERLLERIIHIATDPGDIVLDCFAGSGATAAVAHKMGRRWVTIEVSEDTLDTFTEPRLRKVVADEDPGGITSQTSVELVGDLPEGMDLTRVKTAADVLGDLYEHGAFDELPKVPRARKDEPLALLVALLRDNPAVYRLLLDHIAAQMRAAAKTRKVVTKRWSGGGGFTRVLVGPSMFETVEGVVVLSDWATGGALAEAVAAQLGFDYETDGPFAGTKGRTRLAVIDGMLTTGVADYLVGHLGEKQQLRVVAQALEPGVEDYLRTIKSGARAQKVPRDLASVGHRPSHLVRLGDGAATEGEGEQA